MAPESPLTHPPLSPWQTLKHSEQLFQRLSKTLHHGNRTTKKKPLIDCSSLPLTEVTVDLFEKTIEKGRCLDRVDVNYATHVLQQASLSPASIMIAMIYLERLKGSNSEFLQKISPCELFLVSLVRSDAECRTIRATN